MNFTLSGLLAGLIFSTIGFWLIREGRRNTNIPVTLIGATLLIYSFFTPTPLTDWGIGIALCLAARYFWSH